MKKQLEIIRHKLDENSTYSAKVECLCEEIEEKIKLIQKRQEDIKKITFVAWLFKLKRRNDNLEYQWLKEEIEEKNHNFLTTKNLIYFTLATVSISIIAFSNVQLYFSASENKMI